MTAFFEQTIYVPQPYLPFVQRLYPLLLVFILFHFIHHAVSTRSLFITAFQGSIFNYWFWTFCFVLVLTCFAYYLVEEHLWKIEFEKKETEEEFILQDVE